MASANERQRKHPFSPDEFDSLLRWFVESQSKLLALLLDVCRFRGADCNIQPILALKSGLTWARVQYLTAVVLTERNPFIRKSLFFQVVDQLSSLLSNEGRGVKEPDIREALFRKSFYQSTVSPLLQTLPAPFGPYLDTLGDQLYQDVQQQAVAGVWDQKRVTATQVVVPKWDKTSKKFTDTPMDIEDFVAEETEVVRNTLHGYNLNRQQFEQYLLFHTGNVSDYLPDLCVPYLLAGMADPAKLVDRNWK